MLARCVPSLGSMSPCFRGCKTCRSVLYCWCLSFACVSAHRMRVCFDGGKKSAPCLHCGLSQDARCFAQAPPKHRCPDVVQVNGRCECRVKYSSKCAGKDYRDGAVVPFE